MRSPRGKRPSETAVRVHLKTSVSTPIRKALSPGTARGTDIDAATEARVHAWYRATHAGKDSRSNPDPVGKTAVSEAFAPVSGVEKRSPNPLPDLSTAPHKATSADLARAAQQQAESVRIAAAENQSRTTSDDDAAFAEVSHIPSTAPTERIAAPWVHDFSTQNAPSVAVPQQASLTGLDSTSRVNPRSDAQVLSQGAKGAPVGVHLSASDAATPAKLQFPRPVPILRDAAPASSTVAAAAARKPKLDPVIAAGMTEETFADDEDVPESARRTVALSGRRSSEDRFSNSDLTGAATTATTASFTGVGLYDGAGRLLLIPPMKGTHEILVHQNQMAVMDGLDRIEDDRQMLEMRRMKLLVALPDTESIQPDGRLPLNRRFARPWTVRFLNDLSQAHFARFHTPLIVTSAVRTVSFQRHLVRINGNAAPPTGEIASPHLYGQTVDIAKHGMSVTEIAWMRAYLTPVETSGKIDVEEEFQQSCFHISAYRRYLGIPSPRSVPEPEPSPTRTLQQVKATPTHRRHLPTALLATGIR